MPINTCEKQRQWVHTLLIIMCAWASDLTLNFTWSKGMDKLYSFISALGTLSQFSPGFSHFCDLSFNRSSISFFAVFHPLFLPVRVSFYGRLRTSPFLHSEHVPPPFPSSLSNSIHDVITSCPLGDFYICWHMFPSNSKDSSQAASKHCDFPMHPASWCYEAGRQA